MQKAAIRTNMSCKMERMPIEEVPWVVVCNMNLILEEPVKESSIQRTIGKHGELTSLKG